MARPRLPGSVFQRKADGLWVASLRRDGKVVRKTSTTEAGAKALLRDLRAGKIAVPVPKGGITVAEWVESWSKTTLPTLGRKPGTVTLYLGNIRSVVKPTLGDVTLAAFSQEDARQWRARLEARGKPASSKTAYTIVAQALDAAVLEGKITTNPVRMVTSPAVPAAQVPYADADAVDSTLLPACAEWPTMGPMVVFVALTGVRVGEARGLRWADVDLEGAVATIRRSTPETTSTKGGRSRAVPLMPEVVAALRQHRAEQAAVRLVVGAGWRDMDIVFSSAIGTPLDDHNARTRLREKLVELKMPHARPWHSLRHGLSARLLRRDVPLPVVSALLGHSSIKITADTYGHIEPAMHADQIAEAMGR